MTISTFAPTGAPLTFQGSVNDDMISVDTSGAGGFTHSIVGGAGTDTVMFDGLFNGVDYDSTGSNQFTELFTGTVFNLTTVENFQFENGTITSNASAASVEFLLDGSVTTGASLTGPGGFFLGNVLDWDGATLSGSGGWTVQSVNGAAASGGANFGILDGGTVAGTVTVNGGSNGVTVSVNQAYNDALGVGETATVTFDAVLTDGTDSYAQTFSVEVTGEESSGDNTYDGANGAPVPADFMAGDDHAILTSAGDATYGNDGNDTIYGGDGNDRLIGGDGDDVLGGGDGNDVLVGNDTQDSNGGVHGTGSNTLFGGAGDDNIVIGGTSANAAALVGVLTPGGLGAAIGAIGGVAYGGDGDDNILGTASGDDTIYMGDGNDEVLLGTGNNTVYGGTDDTGVDIVNVAGGSQGNNTIYTGGGNDIVSAGGGDDVIGGGAGDDAISAGGGADIVYGGSGDDTVNGDGGADYIYGGSGGDQLHGDGGDDTIEGGDGNDFVWGDGGNDVLFGDAGNDVLEGGNGADILNGGTGDDNLRGGTGNDVFVFSEGDGNDMIMDFNLNVPGEADQIDLSALGLSGMDDLSIITGGGQTVISYGDEGDSITLDSFIGTLTDSDFIF